MALKGKQLLGQPWWVWAAGGAAILGGYLWIRHRQNAAASQSQDTGTSGQAGVPPAYTVATVSATEPTPATVDSPTGTSWAQLMTWLHDHQGSPGTGSSGGGGGGSGKPVRDKHPHAFHVRQGEHPPTTRHGNRVWVHSHYGPNGKYHPGHWSGSGAVKQGG